MSKVVLVRKPKEEQIEEFAAYPSWEHDVDSWAASYNARKEIFLVTEGRAYVETPDGTRYRFTVGDLVTLPPHDVNDWTWNVEEKIKKHYVFETIE